MPEKPPCPGATRRGVAPTPSGGTISMPGFGGGSPHHIVYQKTPDLPHNQPRYLYLRTKKRHVKNDFILTRFVFYCNVIFKNWCWFVIPGNVCHPKLGEEPFFYSNFHVEANNRSDGTGANLTFDGGSYWSSLTLKAATTSSGGGAGLYLSPYTSSK